MNALDFSTNRQYSNKLLIINMASWMRNKIANLYNDVLAPVAATQDALVEQLQYMRETDTL